MTPPNQFEIPEQMRDMADRSVDQARAAVTQFLDATQKAVAAAEGSAQSMRSNAAGANRKALALVEENIAASFDLAQALVRARTVEEIAGLQQEYFKRQFASVAEQGKRFGEMMGQAAAAATKLKP